MATSGILRAVGFIIGIGAFVWLLGSIISSVVFYYHNDNVYGNESDNYIDTMAFRFFVIFTSVGLIFTILLLVGIKTYRASWMILWMIFAFCYMIMILLLIYVEHAAPDEGDDTNQDIKKLWFIFVISCASLNINLILHHQMRMDKLSSSSSCTE